MQAGRGRQVGSIGWGAVTTRFLSKDSGRPSFPPIVRNDAVRCLHSQNGDQRHASMNTPRELVKKIEVALNIHQPTDWYLVTKTDVARNGGKSLFKRFASVEAVLKAVYPDILWESERFATPHGHWKHINNQREELDRIGRELGVQELEDWYKISRKQVLDQGCSLGVFKHHSSLGKALKAVYPDFPWQASKFEHPGRIASGPHQLAMEEQKEVVDGIAQDLGIKQLSDWYGVSRREFVNRGGRSLLNHYTSLSKILAAIYPQFPWNPSKFVGADKLPHGYWRDEANMLHALEKAEIRLGIEKPEDWYSVTLTDLRKVGYPAASTRLQLAAGLASKYPDFNWEKLYLLRGRYAQQKRLEKAIDSLFPEEEIVINSRKEAALRNPDTGDIFELDIYIPGLSLALEYQARHTYHPVEYYKHRDALKQKVAKEKGLTLLIVPCWWDGKIESLVASIRSIRPDLLDDFYTGGAKPIPEEAPPRFFDNAVPTIPDIGQPMTAGFFTLSNVDPTDWWIFEKYDGVRAFWHPHSRVFYSRFGRPFSNVPQAVIDAMPQDLFLDGELWFGRQSFQEAMKIVQRMDSGLIDWDQFKFMAFDVPNHNSPYSERFKLLEKYVSDKKKEGGCKYVDIAAHEVCKDITHLEQYFQDVIDKGGEGVILRDPNALYQAGRSNSYLKHKKFRDSEAKVIGSAGVHHWKCELPNGVQFVAPAGTSEFTRRCNPQPGDIVTFKHHGFLLATKRPKFPSLYRIRTDISWEEVTQNWKEQKAPTGLPIRRLKRIANPKGHWKDPLNRRAFFIALAKDLEFDPMQVDNWANVTTVNVTSRPGGASVLGYCKGSIHRALQTSFPELDFKFKPLKPKGHWHDQHNRRNFFTEFAVEHGFDVLDSSKWETVTPSQLASKQGGSAILQLFDRSIPQALHDALPELVNNVTTKAGQIEEPDWRDVENRKMFFKKVAYGMGFDPLDPSSWHKVTKEDIIAQEGLEGPLGVFDGSLHRALEGTFDGIDFGFPPPLPTRRKRRGGSRTLLEALS